MSKDDALVQCLDEGDRMLDMGFDEDIKDIFSFFKNQRQTLIFSATMPRKFKVGVVQGLKKPQFSNCARRILPNKHL